MSQSWFPVHVARDRHKKTKRLARNLAANPPPSIQWRLMAKGLHDSLLEFCCLYCPGGGGPNLIAEDLADYMDWPGDPAQPMDVLLDAGFVDRDEDGILHVHDWDEYSGGYLASVEKSKRANHQRWCVGRGVSNPACEICVAERDIDPDSLGDSLGDSTGESREEERRSEGSKEPSKAPKKSKTSIPEDWEPNEKLLSKEREKHPTLDLALEAEKFRNHAQANGRVLKDWDAAWRNWLINAEDYKRQRQGQTSVGSRGGEGKHFGADDPADLPEWVRS